MRLTIFMMLAAVAVVFSGCGSDNDSDAGSSNEVESLIDDIASAVDKWESATTLQDAQVAAQQARALVTGDAETVGLLPSEDGQAGIASPLGDCAAVERDVLGGSWADPAERWQILADAIASWSSTNNPFPSLPSHPQRIIGWATLTLGADTLEEAHEFAGHAQIHVRVSRDAVSACR